jgi:glycosyltransferase involved in cell wall biosynthesis
MSILHNGVDHILRVSADSSILDELDLRTRPYILAAASVQKHKNLRVVLDAVPRFSSQDLALVLVGAASRSDFAAIGHELPQSVILAGRVSDGRMRGLIESAKAFAFPSLTEGFGLPPLEAMLLGTPAVVAPCGALPELCGNDVLYADAAQPEDWADAINQIVENDERRSLLSRSGKERAKTYRWSATAERFAKILRQHA